MNTIVHLSFFDICGLYFLFSIWCTRRKAIFKVWYQGSENAGSQQHFKFRDKVPMDSSKILRFPLSRCIVYKDGYLKLSVQLLFCKWDVILLKKKNKPKF